MIGFPDNLYGESLFTTTRLTSKGLFYQKEHLLRLKKGVEEYYLERLMEPMEEEAFFTQLKLLFPATSENCAIRLKICLGERQDLIAKNVSLNDLQFSCLKRDLESTFSSLKLKTFNSPFTQDYPDLKMGSYMPHFYFKKKANAHGFDDALFLLEKSVLSATTSNIFFIKEGQIITPKNKILSGIIRDILINKMGAKEEDISLEAIKSCEGAFLTNSVFLIREIKSIDHILFTKNHDNLLNELRDKLEEYAYE